MDPVFKYLDSRIVDLCKPIDPEKMNNWHDKRLFNDGGAAEATRLLSWLHGRSLTSPDEA